MNSPEENRIFMFVFIFWPNFKNSTIFYSYSWPWGVSSIQYTIDNFAFDWSADGNSHKNGRPSKYWLWPMMLNFRDIWPLAYETCPCDSLWQWLPKAPRDLKVAPQVSQTIIFSPFFVELFAVTSFFANNGCDILWWLFKILALAKFCEQNSQANFFIFSSAVATMLLLLLWNTTWCLLMSMKYLSSHRWHCPALTASWTSLTWRLRTSLRSYFLSHKSQP